MDFFCSLGEEFKNLLPFHRGTEIFQSRLIDDMLVNMNQYSIFLHKSNV